MTLQAGDPCNIPGNESIGAVTRVPPFQLSTTCHHCGEQCTNYRCQWPDCGRMYCNKCLMRTYRYSKKALKRVKKMHNWGCPFCRKKCFCDKCATGIKDPSDNPKQSFNKGKRTGILLKKEVAMIKKEANIHEPSVKEQIDCCQEVDQNNEAVPAANKKTETIEEDKINLGLVQPAAPSFYPVQLDYAGRAGQYPQAAIRQPCPYVPMVCPPIYYNIMQIFMSRPQAPFPYFINPKENPFGGRDNGSGDGGR